MQVKQGKYNFVYASAAVVVISIVISIIFYQSYSTKNEYYNVVNNKLNQESKRFTKLDDLSLLVSEYQERFNKYAPIKRFENENRLYWLDSLDKIRLQHKIPQLNYDIGVRKPYDYKDGIIKTKGIKVFVSEISISMNLMHEADLISVVDSLKKIKDSIHIVNSCELERIGAVEKTIGASSIPNIKAKCNVKWFTFKVV